MRRIYTAFLFATLGLALVSLTVSADRHRSVTADSAHLVRSAYDGDRALETVAFLDQYVRWPGNRGFDAAIDHIAVHLEAAGYVREKSAPANARLTYRIEEYPMEQPAWEPLNASVTIVGSDSTVLSFATNRNMLARRSYSTPAAGVTAELVKVGKGTPEELDAADIRGKIVLADWDNAPITRLVRAAVLERGATGVLTYDLPGYVRPESNRHSIQFRGLRANLDRNDVWAISLSFDARERLHAALAEGPVQLNVLTKVRWTQNAVERTVVADIHGSEVLDERFVFSAHVQEPGANDNASGVGAQLQMADVAAGLVHDGKIDPKRTVTFLWGDEIVSTARYVTQNDERAEGILWGLSLDMVGQDTQKTGGTFLIEKMPDPSAIWTRGEDQHTEYGGDILKKADMTPHYFNDLVLGRALEQAATNGWVVKANPFEGGSDHVPFLENGIPGLLLWHFTDQFYHTDGDRLDKVSADEMKNVGVTALVTALAMASADGEIARGLIAEVQATALARLAAETELSIFAIDEGADSAEQRDIVETWAAWYDGALASMDDIEVGGSSAETKAAIEVSRQRLRQALSENVNSM